MTRRRLLPIVILVMLLASLFSAETAEVWCRVAVGATVDVDDDDGPYFTCRQTGSINQAESVSHVGNAITGSAENAFISSVPRDGLIVDEPTFSLPQHGLAVVPLFSPSVAVILVALSYTSETRALPAHPSLFARPPPRGPPCS